MFIGRECEILMLQRVYDEQGFGMVVVYGRRRIGKTTLIRWFAEQASYLGNILYSNGYADWFNTVDNSDVVCLTLSDLY